jgi:hypothetical protein
MSEQPSFIETSKGYINLSLAKTIKVQRDIVWFWFGGDESVELPLQEGERILGQLI